MNAAERPCCSWRKETAEKEFSAALEACVKKEAKQSPAQAIAFSGGFQRMIGIAWL